jgi:hypothetical protein
LAKFVHSLAQNLTRFGFRKFGLSRTINPVESSRACAL